MLKDRCVNSSRPSLDIKLIQSHSGLHEALSQEIRGQGAGREQKSIGRSRAKGEIEKRDGERERTERRGAGRSQER